MQIADKKVKNSYVTKSTSSTISVPANTVTTVTSITLTRGRWLIFGKTEVATTSGQNTGALQSLLMINNGILTNTQFAFVHDTMTPLIGVFDATGSVTASIAAYANEAAQARGGSISAIKICDI